MTDQIISPDGTMTDMPEAQGDDGGYTLQQMQDVVGGLIQLVAASDGRTLVVNEEGLLKELEYNYEASNLAGFPIMGTVLACDDGMIT